VVLAGRHQAVFLERVHILAEYERVVRSPSFEMKLPFGRVAEDFC